MMDMLTMALQMPLDKLIEADNTVERDEHGREGRAMPPESQRMMA
jgi:hypothetical protein